jgi:predicted PurR-regulated permease PerM
MITEKTFIRRTFIVAGIAVLVVSILAVLSQMAYVLLLLFAAVLFAIFLDGLAEPLQRYFPLPQQTAASLVALAFIGLLALTGYLIGPSVGEQVMQLADRLPQAKAELKNALNDYTWGRSLISWLREQWQSAQTSPKQMIMNGLTGAFPTLFGTLSDILIVMIMGFYLAFHPKPYVSGLLLLFPENRRARVAHALSATRNALLWWLIGRGASMLVVGVLTAVGLWLINMPLVLALSVLAALFSFVPFLGPIAAAVPAVLVGLVESPHHALNVVFVYAAVQFLESNFITPLIQVRAVTLLPAVLLSSQIFMGVLFGIFGLLLATPLMVALRL